MHFIYSWLFCLRKWLRDLADLILKSVVDKYTNRKMFLKTNVFKHLGHQVEIILC